jgi:hypothetical protein
MYRLMSTPSTDTKVLMAKFTVRLSHSEVALREEASSMPKSSDLASSR